MAIFFSKGGPTLVANPAITKICLTAVFHTKISLKAVLAQCND